MFKQGTFLEYLFAAHAFYLPLSLRSTTKEPTFSYLENLLNVLRNMKYLGNDIFP